MENVKTFVKNNVYYLFLVFILLLSLIGIISAIYSAREEAYDSPFLIALPVSNALLILFVLFSKTPKRDCFGEENCGPQKPSIFSGIIKKTFFLIIMTLVAIIIVMDFTMTLCVAVQFYAAPPVFP